MSIERDIMKSVDFSDVIEYVKSTLDLMKNCLLKISLKNCFVKIILLILFCID